MLLIRNRCLTKGNNSDKTPDGIFVDKKPTVYHLRDALLITKLCLIDVNLTQNQKKIYSVDMTKKVKIILGFQKKRFICSRNVKFDEQQFYYSVSKDSSRSFAFQLVLNNQNTEIPTGNNQDGTNDPGILPTSTANVDESTHSESTH